jgi:hypothetical protein
MRSSMVRREDISGIYILPRLSGLRVVSHGSYELMTISAALLQTLYEAGIFEDRRSEPLSIGSSRRNRYFEY